MKKFGFTLAEVLTTLTVVGVVATLTLPNIMGKANTTSHAGPKLAKMMTAFEQANIAMMQDNNIEKISDKFTIDSANIYAEEYFKELNKYLKITTLTTTNTNSAQGAIMKDGTAYILSFVGKSEFPKNSTDPAYKQKIGSVIFDIDGIENTYSFARDWFSFTLWNDGSLRPKGAAGWDGTDNSKPGGKTHWKTKCPINGVNLDADKRGYCAGHIFENNLKILYK